MSDHLPWAQCRLQSTSVDHFRLNNDKCCILMDVQVDVDEPDAQRFPAFSSLQHYDCILEPGDMLYIPPKWWHYVKSLSVSFSVSFWWSYAGSW